MELKPLKYLISLTEDEMVKEMAPIRERQIRSQAENKIAGLDAKILREERNIHESLTKKEINLDSLSESLEEIDLMEQRKKRLVGIVKQLFPE